MIIGTSAGSTVAAQITSGVSPSDLLASILASSGPPRARPVPPGPDVAPNRPVADHMERTNAIIGAARDADDMRRRLGAAALEMDDQSSQSAQTQWRATVASRLPRQQWPEQSVLIVAVDARTGEPVVFDRYSGIDLVDAVAARCGAMASAFLLMASVSVDTSTAAIRRSENADLAIFSMNECWCSHPLAVVHSCRSVAYASRRADPGPTRARQQRRDHLPGRRRSESVWRQHDGIPSTDRQRHAPVTSKSDSWRAAYGVLALTVVGGLRKTPTAW